MGFFNSKKFNQDEERLVEIYTGLLSLMQGISEPEAKKQAVDMVELAISEAKNDGTYDIPENFGDVIFENATTSNPSYTKFAKHLHERYNSLSNEGLKKEDVLWWWNMSDVARRVMIIQDQQAKMTAYLTVLEEADQDEFSDDEGKIEYALNFVSKIHPVYGNPDDTSKGDGDDRPLPHELRDRVNIYIQKRAGQDSNEYREEMMNSTSFNALVRRAIREGLL